jgi:hypothetical protein
VHVAFNDRISLDFDAFSRGHGPDDSSADNNLFRLDITLNGPRLLAALRESILEPCLRS